MAKSYRKIKETPLQIQFVHALRLDFAEQDLVFSSTQNGAHLPKIQSKRTGKFYCPEAHKLKAMGMLEGISDLLFWWPVAIEEDGVTSLWLDSGFIEVKTIDGSLEPSQIEFRRRIKAMGGKYAVARSYEAVRDTLIGWGVKCQRRIHL